jgi:hypothetical protein
MSKDVTVILKDEPGELAALGEATGAAGVNIQGMAAFTGEGRVVIHLLFDDDDVGAARQALEDAGLGIADEREVLVIDVEDLPGTFGRLVRALGDANINIQLAYTTFGGIRPQRRDLYGSRSLLQHGLVVATDDMEAARAALD